MSLAWGGYANGRIPTSALHPVPSFKPLGDGWSSAAHSSNVMKTAAAVQLSAMQRAFFHRFNVVLYVREAYRNMDGQSFYRRRMENKEPGWTLAALPGTSVHGWALSVDFGVGEANANPSGVYLQWLRDNAATYGFRNDVPTEVWHWSFLLTPTSGVTTYIPNPTASTADASTSEDDMGIRIIRNATKGDKRFGEVWAISLEGQWAFHIPNSDYQGAWEKVYGIETEELAANWFGYWLGRATAFRPKFPDVPTVGAIADAVWAETITAKENGAQPASARLAGADLGRNLQDAAIEKVAAAVAKKVPASGGTVVNGAPIDVAAIAKAVSALVTPAVVKAVGDDLAKRLQA